MKTQLLCTFTTKEGLDDVVKEITNAYTIVFGKVYVLQNEDNINELICTYNVEATDDYIESSVDTISIHRKKQSNSLYTINALNELVKTLNNGVLDNSFPIPWENYRNRMLLTNEEGLYEIPTRVYSIIHTKTWKSDIDEK